MHPGEESAAFMEIDVARNLPTDVRSDHGTLKDPIERTTDVDMANKSCATKTRFEERDRLRSTKNIGCEEKIDSAKCSKLMAQHERDRLAPGFGDKMAI